MKEIRIPRTKGNLRSDVSDSIFGRGHCSVSSYGIGNSLPTMRYFLKYFVYFIRLMWKVFLKKYLSNNCGCRFFFE